MSRVQVCMLVGLLWAALPAGEAAAQQDVFVPDLRYFRTPIADPNAARISAGILSTDLLVRQQPALPPFAEDIGPVDREGVAAVAIGAVFPLLHLDEWDGGGALLFADGRVFSRFRIEFQSRDDMGQDWFVGGGIEVRQDALAGRAAIMHRSSHIGDEFAQATGADRIEFGGEQLDVLAAYDIPEVARVYAGGSWIFRSYLNWDARLRELDLRDRALVQLGIDREWHPWRDQRLAAFAGVDWHAAERTRWRGALAAAVGAGVRAPGSTRSLRIVGRAYSGYSTMGEFFLTPERYFTIELVGEF